MKLQYVLTHFAVLAIFSAVAKADDDEELPVGTTNQQNISIDYQSAKKKNLCVYRVRNTPKGVFTPFSWQKEKEVLLSGNLPRCEHEKEPCDWVEAKIPTVKIAKDKTHLGYGVNADQAFNEPDAFVRAGEKKGEGETPSETPLLETTLTGTFADKKENTYKITLTVTSSVKAGKEEGKKLITYEYKTTSAGQPMTLKAEKPDSRPRIVWESVQSQEYKAALEKQGPLIVLMDSKPKATIEVMATEIVLVEKHLKIMVGDETIASVRAPAYVPPAKKE